MKLALSIIILAGAIGGTLGYLNAQKHNAEVERVERVIAEMNCAIVKELEGAGDASCVDL